jgi:hypothetical protein
MGSDYRTARQQPWYHQPLPRCITETVAKTQCTFSARYEIVGKPGAFVCKTHGDMLLSTETNNGERPVKLKRIAEAQIFIY